ncbi:MAG: hypothetical protein QOE89_1715, partial [Pseudonocardiales bacterium]|nr:hypothetical protein [Pseudonocardiales bacterium]
MGTVGEVTLVGAPRHPIVGGTMVESATAWSNWAGTFSVTP